MPKHPELRKYGTSPEDNDIMLGKRPPREKFSQGTLNGDAGTENVAATERPPNPRTERRKAGVSGTRETAGQAASDQATGGTETSTDYPTWEEADELQQRLGVSREKMPETEPDEEERYFTRDSEAAELIKRFGLSPSVGTLIKALDTQRANYIAKEVVQEEKASNLWTPPAESGGLAAALVRQRIGQRYVVDSLIGAAHNVSLAAQYKTGKTTLAQNLAYCLATGEPFLDRETSLGEGRIGFLNGEMDDEDWTDVMRPLAKGRGRGAAERIEPLHLRGARLPILSEVCAAWFIDWLKRHEVRFLILDSWRKLCVWNGVNENDNDGVGRLTDQIDYIKAEAGVAAFLSLAHTGRGEKEHGKEHGRGATALDDWVDARWVMTSQSGQRFLYAEGRGVAMEETALVFDSARCSLSLGSGSRRDVADDEYEAKVLAAVEGEPGQSMSALQQGMGITGKDTSRTKRTLLSLQSHGLIYHVDRNAGPGWNWYPGERPDDARACRETCEIR